MLFAVYVNFTITELLLTLCLRTQGGQSLLFYNTTTKLLMHLRFIIFSSCKMQDIFNIEMEKNYVR